MRIANDQLTRIASWVKTLPLWRLGLVLAAITLMVFTGILSSAITAQSIEGNAGAINQAGALRMQVYRITAILIFNQGIESKGTYLSQVINEEIGKFDHKLYSYRLIGALPTDVEHELMIAYNQIIRKWKTKVKPLLQGNARSYARLGKDYDIDSPSKELQQHYITVITKFALDIDRFVLLLERAVESKISRLNYIQATTLISTLIMIVLAMYLLHSRVLTPLRRLLSCAESARHGDFSLQADYTSDDELGQLSSTFNLMAHDLSVMHSNWETRVKEKTHDLQRSNLSLELLYNSIRRLTEAPLSDSTYNALLKDLEEPLGIGPGAICLSDTNLEKPFILASTRTRLDGGPDICAQSNCYACFGDGTTHTFDMSCGNRRALPLISIPILDQEKQIGVLLMEVRSDTQLEEWQTQLLEAVAQHIGMALNITQRVTESRRLALLEERSVIARELHDSLAQSLSYLKIQATRLNAALSGSATEGEVEEIIDELREGISSAYKQLRELLTTFRLKMDGRGLNSAVEETVKELTKRSDITISLNNQLEGCQLNAHEEIHVLQVVREVLANAISHAKATTVEVRLKYCGTQDQVSICINDDGIGIPEGPERPSHYGLAIINERAAMLGGDICLSRRPNGGTKVELTFAPSTHR